jgi:hypothetical protein
VAAVPLALGLGFSVARCPAVVSRIRHDAAKPSLSACPLCPFVMPDRSTRPRARASVRLGRPTPTRSPRHGRSQSYTSSPVAEAAKAMRHPHVCSPRTPWPLAPSARAAAWSAPAGGGVRACAACFYSGALTSKAVVVPDLAWHGARSHIPLLHFNYKIYM